MIRRETNVTDEPTLNIIVYSLSMIHLGSQYVLLGGFHSDWHTN